MARSAATAPSGPIAVDLHRLPPIRDRGSIRRDSVRARQWTLRGQAKVSGPVEAGQVDASELLSITGSLTVGDLRSVGILEIAGATQIQNHAHLDGYVRLGGALTAGSVEGKGSLVVVGPVVVHGDFRWRGWLETHAPLQAGRLSVKGTLRASGAVQTQQLDLLATSASWIPVAKAEHVHLRSSGGVRAAAPDVRVDRIEAGDVDIAGVDVDYVLAGRIVAGPRTYLHRYDGTLVRAHPSARVGPAARIEVPPGLSR